MSPDPPVDPLEGCLSCSYDVGVALHSSDDSDTESESQHESGYDGYTLLGQNDLGGGSLNNEDMEETGTNDLNETGVSELNVNSEVNQSEPAAPLPAGRAELAALWNMPTSGTFTGGITMDDERSAQIRAAMAGFTLPASSVPAWANSVPEEQWKQRLLDRLQHSEHRSLAHAAASVDSKSSVTA